MQILPTYWHTYYPQKLSYKGTGTNCLVGTWRPVLMTTVRIHSSAMCSLISLCCQDEYLTCHKEMISYLCKCLWMFLSGTVKLDSFLSFFFFLTPYFLVMWSTSVYSQICPRHQYTLKSVRSKSHWIPLSPWIFTIPSTKHFLPHLPLCSTPCAKGCCSTLLKVVSPAFRRTLSRAEGRCG
jgi:hypothetical protein